MAMRSAVILHVDLDAFYAQVEARRLGLDPGTPIAVQQWDGLIAVNYPAKALGITRHMRVAEAKQKCPALTLVHVETIGDVPEGAGPNGANPKKSEQKAWPPSLYSYEQKKVSIQMPAHLLRRGVDAGGQVFRSPHRDLAGSRGERHAKIERDQRGATQFARRGRRVVAVFRAPAHPDLAQLSLDVAAEAPRRDARLSRRDDRLLEQEPLGAEPLRRADDEVVRFRCHNWHCW